LQRSAAGRYVLPSGGIDIAQYIELFRGPSASLNLRVEGSIPSRLTNSKLLFELRPFEGKGLIHTALAKN
jgi:hypothetical protein